MKVEDKATIDLLYGRLAAEFEHVHQDTRGGVRITYVTGEQVTSRLNEELGFDRWQFEIVEHGLHVEANEFWVRGRLSCWSDLLERWIVREQFGSQKIKRPRGGGAPLDIGFDLKGAATDALKKCASLIGVGLYLSHREEQPEREPSPTPGPSCADCKRPILAYRFSNGEHWSVAKVVDRSRSEFGVTLCIEHCKVRRASAEAAKAPAGEA